MRLPALLFASFFALPPLALAQPAMSCTQDADCGACGWVCGAGTNHCYTAGSDVGSCTGSAGCGCAGQTCTGQLNGQNAFCLPAFVPQCLCDADCPSGQVCDTVTLACHPRPAACQYDGICGCGYRCEDGGCTGDGGCPMQAQNCLTQGDGGNVLNGGDSGAPAPGCHSAGVSCQDSSECCGGVCEGEACACNVGDDPGFLACATDGDCCSPATCVNHVCFLKGGRLPDGGTGKSASHGCGCGALDASALALLGWLRAAGLIRRRRPGT